MTMMHGHLNTQTRQCLTNQLGAYDCDLSAHSDGVNEHKQQIRVSRGVEPHEYADQYHVGYYETPSKRMRQETKMINKEAIYSYKLIKGYSTIKGGICVLRQLKYPNKILKSTEKIIRTL